VNLEPHGKIAEDLWMGVEEYESDLGIFSKQRDNGSWFTGGAWAGKPTYTPKGGFSPFTPKHVTTIWILMVLGEMGFRIGDSRINKACEYVLSHQLQSGLFLRFAAPTNQEAMHLPQNAPCELSGYLKALGCIGMATDHRLSKSYDLLLKWQRDDGGWVTQKHLEERFKTRSCPCSTHSAAMALYLLEGMKHEASLRKALEFLVWHLSLKDPHKICRFRFRGHEMLNEMLMLSDLGIGLDKQPVQAVLNWLMSMYDEERGCFHFSGRRSEATDRGPQAAKYLLYQCIEDDWLTYRALRIAINLRKTN